MILQQGLNNVRLSMLGADVATGADYALGVAGAKTSVNSILRSIDRTAYQNIGPLSGAANNYFNANNISIRGIFRDTTEGFGTSTLAYYKSTPVYIGNYSATGWYTSSSGASGMLIAGTNGDYAGAFLGYGPNYETYYIVGGPSKHWRIGVNIYRVAADGSDFYRVYTHHHLADYINDQSTASIGLGPFYPGNHVKRLATIFRNQGDGKPTMILSYYDPVGNTVNGNSWISGVILNDVNEWGQVLDAINIESVGNSETEVSCGAVLWQRQWWGPRVVFFKHNGSSVLSQTMRTLDVFYQSWITDHNFGGQGGVAYSPVSNKCVAIFQYEPNGTSTGRNLAINSFTVNNADGDPNTAITCSGVATDIIHFIWGTTEPCKADLGTYSAAHIAYMHSDGIGDWFAYAFINNSQDRVIIRLATVNWSTWASDNNRCNWPDFGDHIYTGINHYQRVRVTRLNVIPHSDPGQSIITFAASYVNSSNQTVVKIFRYDGGTTEEIASYVGGTNFNNYRGLLAANGTPGSMGFGAGRGQHALVIGTTNDGLQDTYIWGGKGDYLGRSGDQDLSVLIKYV